VSRLGQARLAASWWAHQLKPRTLWRHGSVYAGDRAGRGSYRSVSGEELRATRTSDTAFVLGSGSSVRDLVPAEWERIAAGNTLSFSEFHRQSFVRADYHMVGEITDAAPPPPERAVAAYARSLRENPLYADTVLLLQEGWLAVDSNALVARRLLRPDARVFRYRRTSRGAYSPPSNSFDEGLVHGWNTSISVTNLALLLGFSRVVLVGVDMYNREYFWLEPGERRPTLPATVEPGDPFLNARPVIDLFARWRALLEPRGIELSVYNPRSLLAGALPVFDRGS
jgi:hypothetical protein